MKQIFRALVVAVFLVAAGPASALGLGRLEQDSALNERFEGRIPLLSASADELATLKVGLADQDAFRRAGINYAHILRDLKFTLVEPESGQDYIHVTSSQPIREPFLNFLVELSWSSGRLYREYTVLLDPPLYDPGQKQVAAPSSRTSPPAQDTTAAAPSKYSHTVIYPDEQPAATGRAAPGYAAPAYSGGDYGPVQSGDTLWSIANAMKPGSVTTHQMMLALLRTNPDAFIGNNINGLKKGAILRLPSADEMNAMSQSEALAQVKSQHGLWESARQAVAAAPATRADTASAAPAAADADAGGDDAAVAMDAESRLELVGAKEGAAGQTGDAEGSNADLSQELAVANEKLESVQQENAELRDRLAENEALIEDLKRLIALKDDELASLQGRTAEEAAGVTGTPTAPAPSVDGVNYPSGDPAQFIGETPPMGELVPGPVPAAPEISHTVNQPQPGPEAAPAEPEAKPEKAAPKPAAEAEPARSEPPAKTATPEPAPVAAGGGIMGTIMGLVGTARDFIFNNLMIAGGAVLAIIVLLAGTMFMRRRQERIEEEADAVLAAGTFPDFESGADLDQTSFENDSESATEINEADSSARAEADDNDDDATVLNADAAVEEDDEDLFVVPQGEAKPPAGDEEEDDPLAEVNVLMAYEHFDQAESFVRNALKSEPENVEYHAKLLEVFYAAGNRKKYEEAASDLRDLTGGKGEHWDMAVAMWQELSPNRALFEGGEGEEEPAEGTGGGGIVDITGDTAGSSTGIGESTGGGSLDFDLGDSTGGGSATAEESDGMLDLTASQEDEDEDMLDLTAASASEESFEETQTLNKAPSAEQDDSALDISLEGGGGSDLLDVTRSGELDSGEDLLDVTATGKVEDIEETAAAEDDDGSLDFSMDFDTAGEPEAETAKPASFDDDNMLEFDGDFGVDTGDTETAAEEDSDTASAEDDNSLAFDSSDLDLETDDETSGTGDLDEIGEELDRLEQTLGTLSRQDATKGFGSNTSDALDGIDSALEEVGGGDDEESSAHFDTDEDSASEFDISLGGTESTDESDQSDELDISLSGMEVAEEETDSGDDLSDMSIELDSGEDDLSSDLSDLSMELDTDEDSSAEGDDDISAELSELSKGLESGDLDLGDDEGEFSLDTGGEDEASMDFDLDTGDESAGLEDSSGLDLDLSTDDMSSSESIDMDSTVELPKERLGGAGLSLEGDEDDDNDEDQTVFVGRSSDTEEQSLEDELTTKLDLAKAYVELGDADSARSILEEVMQDGNEDQKRQAGELLAQL